MNEKLRKARTDKGLTHKEVALLAGIDRSTYSHCERGRMPSLEVAIKIARVLGKSVEKIFNIEVLNKHDTQNEAS